ncbi:MAG: protein translocase subunit SecF [Firmicutes bacterium]|nr:protein translocase subunit SecF [Bacillota bacterium]
MRKFNIPFVQHRRAALVIAIVIIITGVISLFLNSLNLGIDFSEGTILQLRLAKGYQMEEVRSVLSPFGLDGVPLQRAGHEGFAEGSEVVIKAPYLAEAQRKEIVAAFEEHWPEMTAEDVLRVENVGATVGRELTREALYALLLAAVGMILYITFRFEFKFALAAILALLFDVFTVVTVFSLFKVEINSPFIAAILTIVGYSINDTIVIFDRIRENLKRFGRKKTLTAVVNDSINESLVRSVNTSLTTLVVLVCLFIAFSYFVGSMDLKAFALALLVGIVTGTCSSLFIAGPLWFAWQPAGKR